MDQGKRRREADLKGALKNPNSPQNKGGDGGEGSDGQKGENAKGNEKPFDYQLERALDLIRGISLYNVRVSN